MKPYLTALFIGVGILFGIAAVVGQPSLHRQNVAQRATRGVGQTYSPERREVGVFKPINVREAAQAEALNPPAAAAEIEESDTWLDRPPMQHGVPINREVLKTKPAPSIPNSFGTGVSPGPEKTFKAEFLTGTSIPPDTMGAVGSSHVVVPTNNMMRVLDRNGVELSRVSLTSFWAGTTVKGSGVTSAFDPKIVFDRFNNRFIFTSSLNGANQFSGMGLAVSQTADPTGLWNRYTVEADPNSTGGSGGSGHAIDYPSVGHNENWIVVMENTFNYTCTTSSPFPCSFGNYYGPQIFVFDKQAAYAGTPTVSTFEDPVTNCTGVSPETTLGCGFTMAPSINEENNTDTIYLIEDWDSTAAQLRLSKLTGTASTPVLTIGTQFPQSPYSWRFDARRIGTSGGYAPQRQQLAYSPSATRVMTNDSRIQNAVLRNGSLWTTHTVMLATGTTPAGSTIGGSGNPNVDIRSGIQWWQIDPTDETAASTAPLQRGRIEDPAADNCHNGNGGTRAVSPCDGTTATQTGLFFAFPNISVNVNNDVLIGFAQFSPLTYPNGAYAIRRSTDAVNTTRDPVVFRPGQANYNIGAGSGSSRQNRWGDYSAAQTDPLDDTTFWTVQEYAGSVRDFGIGLAGNWETWFAQVDPAGIAPATNENVIISEFRLRGPQGKRDEFVELYNANDVPLVVQTNDGSEGWALATNDGTTTTPLGVVPWGTVIPARGHFLITDNPDALNGPTVVYSLTGYGGKTDPSSTVRGADGDTGFSVDIPDSNGIAIFRSSAPANLTAGFVMDAAGPSSLGAGSIFKEGPGIGPLPTSNFEYTMYRDLSLTGFPQDSNNNFDFIYADTAANPTFAGQEVGAPGPENLDGPVRLGIPANLRNTRLDLGVRIDSVPNRQRDATDTGTNKQFGTLAFRRTFTNHLAVPVSTLRFRVASITTLPEPNGVADLRLLSASDEASVATTAGPVPVNGVNLQQPPTQAQGGGGNSSGNTAAVNLATPLAANASVNVRFLVGVQQIGAYNLCVEAETLPATGSNVVCYNGNTESVSNLAPTPQISSMSDAGALPTVTFNGDSGSSYVVERKNNLSDPTWTTVTDAENVRGDINPVAVTDPDPGAGTLPKRFYRVVLLQ